MPAAREAPGAGDVRRVTAVAAGDALARLRAVSSNALLTERIPIELSQAGFGAVGFSPIDLPAAATPGRVWPVYVWQVPVGLLHTVDAPPADDADVDAALATFAEGIGAILERNIALAQLHTIHIAAQTHSWEIGSLIEPFGGVPPLEGSRIVASEHLTPRQQQVLRLLASGDTNAQMADRLSITKATIAHHVRRIMRRLGVSDRRDVIAASKAWLGEIPAD